ncbi:3-hydroxyacyl-CoA dehydrogenase NAD-binding domain-containing protein [Verrucomicrobium sp. BvORR106]|uniref:3-hydroxyacyl-CoA dehydrogenase family protein n=1 Tax=Verrucomicrobium sp. BvORR106 TaxID=1403819 RepID=UPI0009DE82B0|nr:3-hydroxyacyl-CoA dehydrogenase NAD-binding domain-containing protein [Verrucomicrobium sp. BvORR106]
MSSATSPAPSLDPLRIGILGAGQMGAAAAVLFRRAGHEVTLWARNEAKHTQIRETTDATEAFLNQHFGPAPHSGGTLTLESRLAQVDETSDAILECVAEEMDQKTALLSQLPHCRERKALIMTCTSALCVTDMARGSGLVGILVGAHFWNPPHLIPVVEVIPGEGTPETQVQRAMTLLQHAGKIAVRCADVPGFIGNRLQHAMWREALALVDAGVCTAQDVDRVVKWTFALRLPVLGPFENMDLVGLPLVQSIESYLFPHLAVDREPARSLTTRVQEGHTGMKAGQGFYDWTQRDAAEVVALRDRQVVQQLQFLKEQGALEDRPTTGA